jgi:hypothetical protein
MDGIAISSTDAATSRAHPVIHQKGCKPSGIVTASPESTTTTTASRVLGVWSGANGWRFAHPTRSVSASSKESIEKSAQTPPPRITLRSVRITSCNIYYAICGAADMTVLLVRKHIIKAAARA